MVFFLNMKSYLLILALGINCVGKDSVPLKGLAKWTSEWDLPGMWELWQQEYHIFRISYSIFYSELKKSSGLSVIYS